MMKKILFFLLFILSINNINSQGLIETDEWKSVLKSAQEKNKNVLLVLTASEWCKPCVKMKERVLKNQEFLNYVENNLVVYTVELPSTNIDMGSEKYKEFKSFQKRYEAYSLPSIVLMNSKEEKIKNLKGKLFSLKNVLKQLQKYNEKRQ